MTLPLWTIYDHPLDFPQWFVARKEVIGRHWPDIPYSLIFHRELLPLRKFFGRQGMIRLPRDASDDPVIVETWL